MLSGGVKPPIALYLALFFREICLPSPLFLLTVIDDMPRPTVTPTDAENVILLFWSDKAVALAYLEIRFAAPCIDELLTDGALQVSWHFVVEVCEASLHFYTFILAELCAMLATNLWVEWVDGCLHH